MKNLIIPALLAIVICSCAKSKTEPPLSLTGAFTPDNRINVDPPVMLTKSGTITDQHFIKAYLQRHNVNLEAKNTFILNSPTASYQSDLYRLEFQSAEKIKLLWRVDSDPIETEHYDVVESNASGLVLNKPDTIVRYPPFYEDEFKVQPLKYPVIITDTVQLDYDAVGYVYVKTFPLEIKDNYLYIPSVTYFVGFDDMFAFLKKYPRNSFNLTNISITGQLNLTDTVVVQTKRLRLKKI